MPRNPVDTTPDQKTSETRKGRKRTRPKCYRIQCTNRVRNNSVFCSDRCGSLHADSILSANHEEWCPICDDWFPVSQDDTALTYDYPMLAQLASDILRATPTKTWQSCLDESKQRLEEDGYRPENEIGRRLSCDHPASGKTVKAYASRAATNTTLMEALDIDE